MRSDLVSRVFWVGAILAMAFSAAMSTEPARGQAGPSTAPSRAGSQSGGEQFMRLIGTVVVPTVELRSLSDGLIKSVAARDGQPVKKGEVLVRLDDRKAAMGVMIAEAELKSAEANVRRAQMLQDAASARAIDVEQARASLEVAKARLEMSKHELMALTIVAPIDGTLLAPGLVEGQFVQRGALLATILQTDSPKVQVPVPEQWAPKLKAGLPVTVKVDAYPERIFSGKTTRISPVVDRATGSILVSADLAADEKLMSGMSATVTLRLAEGKDE